VDEEHAEFVRPHVGAVNSLELIIVVGDSKMLDVPSITFDEILGHDPLRAAEVQASEPASILFTGGTTGPPKGAVLTHGHNLNLARSLVDLFGYTTDDVLYTAFPLFHANAKYIS